MPVRDSVALLRELDPLGGAEATARRPRRRLPRSAATVATVVLLMVVAFAATDDGERRPGLVEAAYAALTAPDEIVHLQLRRQFFHPADSPTTAGLWTRDGTKELRVSYDGGAHEYVRDTDRRYAASYVRHSNTLTIYTDPAMWEFRTDEALNFSGPEGAARLAQALPALLARARDGDLAVRRLPDAKLDGRLAARLEAVVVVSLADGARDALAPTPIRTVVWLDLETHLPRRIERFTGDRRESTTDVVAQRLQANDDTERLLDLAPPPDARRVVGGRR